MNDLSGQTIKGYKILDTIGIGNFGAVYRAHQATIGREVAIKVILPAYANRPEFVRLFEAEAQLVAHLEHPHIVPLFDYWREPDRAYLVMRYLPTNLRRWIREHGKISFEDTVKIVDQLASALSLFHQQGIVHRDIKPDNILLDQTLNVYLSDFGLAKVLWQKSEDDEGVTGSPAYMAPEQLRAEAITPQVDIYSLGIIVYEMLMGEHPFEGMNLSSMIAKHLLEPLPDIQSVNNNLPKAINDVIQRATAKDPASRYDDVLVMAKAVHEALLGKVAADATAELQITSIKNPYKGLRPFEEADSADFFGRETLVSQLIERLSEYTHPMHRFLAVVGPSGSGKSSLVKAGLIPTIRQGAMAGSEEWFVATMVPGPQPFDELEAALLGVAVEPIPNLVERLRANPQGLIEVVNTILGEGRAELLLYIDQFEEIFTLVTDDKERQQFMMLLRQAVLSPQSRVRVVISLRADFYDRPLLYPEFGTLIQSRTYVVLPLSTTELERAIALPAERVGIQLDSNLTAAIIADVREEPGALPLLQYTLTEIFERRDGRTMSLNIYRQLGGVAGAVAQRADEVHDQLSTEQKIMLRQIFLRLVTLGEGTEDIRRRALRSELAAIVVDTHELQILLDLFGRHRLLSFDHEPTTREPTVEIAHEALIRAWGRLRVWLAESRADIRQQRRLAELAAEWVSAKHDPSFLLHGLQLEQFEAWQVFSSVALTAVESDFLSQSITAREAERAAEEANQLRQQMLEARAKRFRAGLLVAVSIGFVIASILSVFAFSQRGEAQDARRDAEQNAQFSQTQAAVADEAANIAERRANSLQSLSLAEEGEDAILANQFDLGVALMVEANRIADAPVRSRQVLYQNAPRSAVRLYTGHTDQVNALAMHPDGLTVFSAGDDMRINRWDIATGAIIQTYEGHTDDIRALGVTPDGLLMLSVGDDGQMLVWDIASGEIVQQYTSRADLLCLAISRSGDLVAIGTRDNIIVLWDLTTERQVGELGDEDGDEGHSSRITSVSFSPDGTSLASGSADNLVIVWNVASGEQTSNFRAHNDVVNDVEFSPDGTLLASVSSDGEMIAWEVATSRPLFRRVGTDRLTSAAFSPDGRYIVVGTGSPFGGNSAESAILLWDTRQGDLIRRYYGHDLEVRDVVFNPTSQYFISAAADNTLRLWAVSTQIDFWEYATDQAVTAVSIAGDNSLMVMAAADNTLSLWQLNGRVAPTPLQTLMTQHTDVINAIAISPDKTRFITASADRSLLVWDSTTYEVLLTLHGHSNQVNDVIFNVDGTQAISASRDRTIIVWDLATGEIIRTLPVEHTNSVNAITLSRDGQWLVSASDDRTLMIWDMASGEVVHRLNGHQSGVTDAVISDDGQFIISVGRDQQVLVWDRATGTILRRMVGHTDWVNAIALSPDDSLNLSVGRDRTARLWNTATGELIYSFVSFTEDIGWVSMEADTALVVSRDGSIRLLPTTAGSFIEWLEQARYVYTLSCEEQARYLLITCE